MIEAVRGFFFDPTDPTALAVFRILIGGITVANAVSYRRYARLLLDPNGMVPFDTWAAKPGRRPFSLLRFLPPSSRSVSALILVYGVAGACLSTGLATPVAATVAFVAGTSLNHRNPHALHSGDAVLRVLTFLLIFSSAGQVLSLDAALKPPVGAASAGWPLRLMQLQMAALYVHAFRFKLKGRSWREGTATHYASNLLAHRKRRLPQPLDGTTAHRVATYATLAVELAGGTLVWLAPTRAATLAGLAALHVTLQLLLRMHLFQWIMLSALVLFVPGETVSSWLL